MFTIRSFNTLALSMINHARATQDEITDFTVGSVARTLLEAPAVELDEFYQLVLAGILDAIPVAVYAAFNFVVIDATTARGLITINFAQPIAQGHGFTIPAATLFKSNSKTYLSESPTIVASGVSTVSLYAVCSESGVKGNCATGAISTIQGFNLPNTATITNTAFVSGRDKESDAERMNRFNDYIKSLVRGTPFSVLFAARSATVINQQGLIVDYVSRYGIEETLGHVFVYIWGSGGAPSQALITAAQEIVDGKYANNVYSPGYRPTGMRVDVVAMTQQAVDVTLLVKVFTGNVGGNTLTTMISTALVTLMAGIPSGGILYAAALVEAVLAVQGVHEAYLESNVNITCAVDKVLILGDLVVTYQ